jgi:hypothetical protein
MYNGGKLAAFAGIFKQYVRSTARDAIHLQFDISADAREIRAVQSPKCIV